MERHAWIQPIAPGTATQEPVKYLNQVLKYT